MSANSKIPWYFNCIPYVAIAISTVLCLIGSGYSLQDKFNKKDDRSLESLSEKSEIPDTRERERKVFEYLERNAILRFSPKELNGDDMPDLLLIGKYYFLPVLSDEERDAFVPSNHSKASSADGNTFTRLGDRIYSSVVGDD